MFGNRRFVTGLGILAAVVLFWMENPWFRPEDISETARTAATLAFWALFIAVVVVMFGDRKTAGASEVQVEGPAFARYLFSNTRAGLFWLPIRLFLGFAWIEAGWHKIDRWRLDRRRLSPRRLLDRRRGDPRAPGRRADHVRVVSGLPATLLNGHHRDLVRLGHPVRRAPRRDRARRRSA